MYNVVSWVFWFPGSLLRSKAPRNTVVRAAAVLYLAHPSAVGTDSSFLSALRDITWVSGRMGSESSQNAGRLLGASLGRSASTPVNGLSSTSSQHQVGLFEASIPGNGGKSWVTF